MKMGSKDTKEMNFWTKEEYLKIADVMMESPMFFVFSRFSTGLGFGKESCWLSHQARLTGVATPCV